MHRARVLTDMRSDALPYTCLSFRAQAAPSVRGRTRKAAQAATAVQNPTPMMVEIPAAGPNFGMSPSTAAHVRDCAFEPGPPHPATCENLAQIAANVASPH